MRNTRSRSTDPAACRQFSLVEIQLSTKNFSDEFIIGSGGFGNVYMGMIDGGATTVAVKRLKEGSKQGENEFRTEIEILSKFQNQHLVSLIGFCSEGKERVLVYEYMPRETLKHHLHKIGKPPLSWERRLKISIGAARGLHYLHTSHHKAIHRDVKSENILLDESWVAKISDFGLSKMGPGNESFTHVSTIVKGTFGYFDPEYFFTNRLTTKSDVYAFGVVLLEVLTGRPAQHKTAYGEGRNLAGWAIDYMKEGKVNDIVDSSLAGQVSRTCLKRFVGIARRCLRKKSCERPDMAKVLTDLESVLALAQEDRLGNLSEQGIPAGAPPGKGEGIPATKYEGLRQFSITEIRQGTGSFNKRSIIGYGGDDVVFIGSLDGGKSNVAIRRRAKSSVLCYDRMDRKLPSHRYDLPLPSHANNNVVSLIGYCDSTNDEHTMFVYDYMANGSLQDHLHKPDNNPLPWKQRLQICIDAARGLCHLQPTLKKTILHDVFNSTNIFLDQNWVAKVSDFGWSRRKQHSAGWCRGVAKVSGDITPTEKSYAYAFGFLLFEVLCANNETIIELYENVEDRVFWFKSQGRDSHSIYIDPYLDGKISAGCFKMYVDTMLHCLRDEFRERPLSKILTSLEGALKLQEVSDGKERALGRSLCNKKQ